MCVNLNVYPFMVRMLDVRWAGKAYFIASSLAGVLCTWYFQLFRKPADGGVLAHWSNGQVLCLHNTLT